MDSPGTKRTCPACGYDLQGLHFNARCPECGWERGNQAGWLEGLDRAPMKAIVGVAVRHGVVVVSDLLLIGLLLLVVVRLPGWYLIAASVGCIGLALGAWFRVSPRQWPPESRNVRLTWGLRLSIAVVLGILASILLLRVVFDAWPSSGARVPAELWVGSIALTIAAAFSTPTANWCRDDVAERMLGSAPWVMALAILGTLVLAGLDITFLGRGIFGRADSLTSLLVVVAWLVVMFGDLSVLWSSIQCMVHRHDHDQVDLRRREREVEWQDEVVSRLAPDDRSD